VQFTAFAVTGEAAERVGSGATSVTRQEAVVFVPAAFTTVRVYWVVTVGVTLTLPLATTAPTPWSITPVPLTKVAVKIVLDPMLMGVFEALNPEIEGTGITDTV
jgi:hypothetical protein